MNVIKTLTGLINDVNNNDIDSLKDLYLELIHLRSELQDINYTHCSIKLPIKKEIIFEDSLKAEVEIDNSNIKVIRAVNGWGKAIDIEKIEIREI